jgi:GT2 family glycosyltransferase/glycosyltransferase involved in cell wall biosynthesis
MLQGNKETEPPAISVVIPTFNRAAMLAATLESFAAQSIPKDRYEIVVVDDGSKDNTSDVCRDFVSRIELKYIHIDNSGTSAAKNTGILACRGKILLFFDDDDIADTRLLDEHLKAHKAHPAENIAVLGYTTWASGCSVTPLMRYVTDIGGFLFAYGELKDGQMLDFTYLWAGRCSCKRSLIVKHGAFNPQFRAPGIEDIELGYRLSRFGLRVVFHRAAVSYMTRTLTVNEFCNRCERQGEALYLFSRLHPDPVVQQYCELPDPFIENRAVAVDPETKWPEVAALFDEKLEQLQRVEALMSYGFEPETPDSLPRAEAYQLQMRELFAALRESWSQVAKQERELSEQERSYQAELKSRHAHYKAEEYQLRERLTEANRLLVRAEERHTAEQDELKERLLEANRVFDERLLEANRVLLETNQLLQNKSISLAEQEQLVARLTDRLRKQLSDTRKLAHLLDDAEKAAARLRSSRRWKLANPAAAIQAKLPGGKALPGYGHLEKIVASYLQWRKSRPEIAHIDDEIQKLTVASVPAQPIVDLTTKSDAPVDETSLRPLPIASLPIESIQFPVVADIEVSIVIPVFNQFQFTHACLASLQEAEEQIGFEVIVVDDCSTDETGELIPQIQGVVYLRNETNAGFIASCNRGASRARGKYLMFLNNDTIVTKGWLTALVDTFSFEIKAGIVGSKLVYADGRLQEAGGIIWRDASGWNYGKFDDPQKPEYNYLREVDYCSGAALMIPKALFASIGGFDTRYAPAYYEDTDLSFKVRDQGYQVLYQPRSEVIHYEGATGGTDVSAGTKKHQEINRSVFAEEWAAELRRKPQVGDVALAQQPPPGRKNILVIDHYVPMPDRDSGSLRMFQILRLLHQLGHCVTFIPDNLANIAPYTGELQKRGIEVWYHPYIKSIRDYLAKNGARYDVVILSRCDFARKHIDNVRLYAPQSRVIFDTVDLHFLRENRQARLTSDSAVLEQAQEKERLEHALIDQADETWVVSEVEQRLLQRNRPGKSIQLVSNIVDIPGASTPFALRRDWLFIGSFQHTPNVDAMIFFLREIYPLVQRHLADAKFYIIGEKVPPEIIALATENIVITGVQSDVRPFFEGIKLSIAPLRFGAGVKGKINQSMAWGVPVVATSLAVEGMELIPGEDILIADEPEQFATALVTLYQSEELWNRLSQNGIEKTQLHYSVEVALEKLSVLFSDEYLRGCNGLSPMKQPRQVPVAAKV